MAAEVSLKDIDRGQISAAVNNTLLEGGKVSDWWKVQERSLLTRVTRTVRAGLNNGLTSQQIAKNFQQQAFKGSRAQAQALVNTAVNAVSNKARVMSFEENKDVIKGKQQVSTFDNRTTDICIAYSGAAWELDDTPIPPTTLPFNGGPPRHFNCRSTLIPVLKSFEELGITTKRKIPEGTRASMDGQIAADTTFSAWLRTKPKTFQDRLLGPARAKLWRGNRITLQQLVDMRGNPLTVDELRELARKKRTKAKRAAAATTAAAPVAAPAPAPAPPPAEPSRPGFLEVPQFKTVAEGKRWIRDNLIRDHYTADGTAKLADLVKIPTKAKLPAIQSLAQVVADMTARFGIKKPSYIGSARGHPFYRLKGSRNTNAAVVMEDQSYLTYTKGLDVEEMRKQSRRQRDQFDANTGTKLREGIGALQKDHYSREALKLNAGIPDMKKRAAAIPDTDPSKAALIKAVDDAEQRKDILWSANGERGFEGSGMRHIWRTQTHEYGHMLHAEYLDEANRLLAEISQRQSYVIWRWQTSVYGRTNKHEFFAEQFVRYIHNDHVRVHPQLLKFFKSKDKWKTFDEPNLPDAGDL